MVRIFILWKYIDMTSNALLDWFSHPGNKTFDDCERKFRTSNFDDGGVLFYESNHPGGWIINWSNSEEMVKKVCAPCQKYQWCLVHETLIKTLTYVKQRNIKIAAQ